MNDQLASLDLRGALRREWWVVLLCAAAAVLAAFLFASASKPEPVSVVTANVDVVPENILRVPGIVTVEGVLSAAQGELRTRIQESGGFSAAEMASLAYASPKPQTSLLIRSRLRDKRRATELVSVAASETVSYARQSAQTELDRRQQQVQLAKQTLQAIEAQPAVTPEQRTSLAVNKWSVGNALIEASANLKIIEGVYSWDGTTSEQTQSPASEERTLLVAALLLGAFLGVVVGGVREYLIRHPGQRTA